jgi:hypothetical protein
MKFKGQEFRPAQRGIFDVSNLLRRSRNDPYARSLSWHAVLIAPVDYAHVGFFPVLRGLPRFSGGCQPMTIWMASSSTGDLRRWGTQKFAVAKLETCPQSARRLAWPVETLTKLLLRIVCTWDHEVNRIQYCRILIQVGEWSVAANKCCNDLTIGISESIKIALLLEEME